MKTRVYWFLPLIILAVSVNINAQVLFESEEYTVFPDRVEQGDFTAKATSRTHIVSDYKSPAKTNFSSTIVFKFAINGNDNEAPSGQDHRLTIIPENGKFISPVIVFGESDPVGFFREDAPQKLAPNTEVVLRVDMRNVLDQFKKTGSFTSWSGEKIPKSAFKGVYIAGGSAPLSWDFDNLHINPSYQLSDEDGDGIFEGTFVFNPYNTKDERDKTWSLLNDISRYPSYASGQQLVDALYNLSLDETEMLKEKDGTFRTGAEWAGVWTRDISYSVLLSYAFLEPEVSKTSLLKKVKNERIIQDTGSGGAWPVSTDRVVWSLAAWELYKVTGDQEWLQKVYPIIKNSIEDDLSNHILDEETGLFKGESSFLDWREQTYPDWMDNVDISQSINLGTNADFYQALKILAEMAGEMGSSADAKKYDELASNLKKQINAHLWNEEKGYYNQFLYGRYYLSASPRFEALGNALCVISGIADDRKSDRIMSEAPFIPFGIPTIYPQIPNIPPYHNNGIWPFVQAYWNWAARDAGNTKALEKGLASLYRPAALFVTNKENFVAQNGDFADTQINSDRQLWSVAGNLAMVYRVFLGMEFQSDKLTFKPMIPKAYSGTKTIKGFKYRDAILDFRISGFGDEISTMKLDGKAISDFEIPGDISGKHEIIITLNNAFAQDGEVLEVENKFSPATPYVQLTGNELHWNESAEPVRYSIYRNGKKVGETAKNSYSVNGKLPGFYQVLAESEEGLTSFLIEPISYFAAKDEKLVEVERYVTPQNSINIENYSGTGAVETCSSKHRRIEIPVFVEEAGTYLLSFRYSNGTGPWNTDNNCAIRTLKVNNEIAGTLVMAQRGTDEWSNWGNSNLVKARLVKGENKISVVFEDYNQNMDGEINQALLDALHLVKIH